MISRRAGPGGRAGRRCQEGQVGRTGARRSIVLGLLLVLELSRTAAAQTHRSVELSGGYAFVRDPTIDLSFPAGWSVGAAGTINDWLSAVADVSGSRASTPTIVEDLRFSVHAFMFGVRASARVGRFVEFGHVLVGPVHGSATAFGVTTTSTRVGTQVGAGLDYPLKQKLAVRGQIDWRWIRGDEQGGDAEQQFRVVAGIVYRLF
jgi:Outer membrane protein beta-barrel domain